MLSLFNSWPSFSHRTLVISRLRVAHSVTLSFSLAVMLLAGFLFSNLTGSSEKKLDLLMNSMCKHEAIR